MSVLMTTRLLRYLPNLSKTNSAKQQNSGLKGGREFRPWNHSEGDSATNTCSMRQLGALGGGWEKTLSK
jgi:hypothetical protein